MDASLNGLPVLWPVTNARPTEVDVHEHLCSQPRSVNIVGLLGNHLDVQTRIYRLYLTYCPYGDLSDLMTAYRNNA